MQTVNETKSTPVQNAVINNAVKTEQPKNVKPVVKAESPKTEKPAEPIIKDTPVDERKYELLTKDGEPEKFRGKQRQIVYNILREAKEPMSIKQIAPLATKAGLTATGGVEPSVRYHLHHMTTDAITKVVNPKIVIE